MESEEAMSEDQWTNAMRTTLTSICTEEEMEVIYDLNY